MWGGRDRFHQESKKFWRPGKGSGDSHGPYPFLRKIDRFGLPSIEKFAPLKGTWRRDRKGIPLEKERLSRERERLKTNRSFALLEVLSGQSHS